MTELRIEDYALIGDCRTGALVGCDGSIDWLCWPRFDSGACFAALLGTPEHGRWMVAPSIPVQRVTRRYLGESNVLETIFETGQGSIAVVDFMPTGQPDSSVVRRVEARGGRVPIAMELILRFDYGSSTPWLARLDDGVSALAGPNLVVMRTSAKVEVDDRAITSSFSVGDGEVVEFAMTWGMSHELPPKPFDCAAALETTLAFRNKWAARCTYNGPWREPVLRSLLTLKALTYTPTGGMVAALTSSLPEQIGGVRNWDYRYCWLRDSTLTLNAFIASGYHEEAQEWYEWLHRAVAGTPAEMQIMYGLSGERNLLEWSPGWLPGYEGSAPVRVGNAAFDQVQHDVAGEVIGTLHLARQHGLEQPDFAWQHQSQFVEHLISVWEQPDKGVWEVRGGRRHFTLSKIMCWVAIDRTIRDAELRELGAPLERWRSVRERMRVDICDKGFDRERNTFTQSYGRPELDASLLLIPQTGFLSAGDTRVQGTIAAIERDLLVDGMVVRYLTNADSGDGLPGDEGSFVACSFWLVGAYVAAGRNDEAQALFGRLLGMVNDVGLLAEEYDPKARRQLGNFPQAFSHLALITAALAIQEAARLVKGEGPDGRP